MSTCPKPNDEMERLRAELAREREERIRAEARAEGERAAYERTMALLADLFALQATPATTTRSDVAAPSRRGDPNSPGAIRSRRYREAREASQASTVTTGDVTEHHRDVTVTPVTSRAVTVTSPSVTVTSVVRGEPRPLPPVGVSPSPAPPPPSPLPPSPSAAAGGAGPVLAATPLVGSVPAADAEPSPAVAFFAWTQEQRLVAYPRALPQPPPPGWAAWYRDALAVLGGSEERLRGAWLAFLADEWARTRRPVCPAQAFIAPDVWRRHVPEQDAPAELEPAPSQPATEAGATWSQVLAALHADGKRYVAEQLTRLTPTLEGDMLVLEAPDRFAAALVQDDYLPLIESALSRLDVPTRSVLIHAAGTH
ncbi:hypothetical protein COCOR_04043 [Corallococcus coralloides DSM 2259]|uniref:DnaA N-terminal domain-containing protein n=1 Tax=Corallococcus coralloides (strain ATCC 25202 / DSM 2259 / NBRC 100086 / M2) TaxID=1144275 RepID=H8MVR2_CORCM|nr:hypothetical protein [Corallococcus coralloides]AFE05592.1 hypothetical protein COCOR_04043 [Corallococcus coralloides DSM 2259]